MRRTFSQATLNKLTGQPRSNTNPTRWPPLQGCQLQCCLPERVNVSIIIIWRRQSRHISRVMSNRWDWERQARRPTNDVDVRRSFRFQRLDKRLVWFILQSEPSLDCFGLQTRQVSSFLAKLLLLLLFFSLKSTRQMCPLYSVGRSRQRYQLARWH